MNYFLDNQNRILNYRILKNTDIKLNLEKLVLQDRIHILEETVSRSYVEGWAYGDSEIFDFYGITHEDSINNSSTQQEIESFMLKLRFLKSQVNKLHFNENKRNKTSSKTIRIYFDASQDLNTDICFASFVVLSHNKKIWVERGFQIIAETIYEAELLALIASIEYMIDEFGFNYEGKRTVKVYGDSKNVIDSIINNTYDITHSELFKKLKNLLNDSGHSECQFHWIPRTHNVYADYICKLAKKAKYKNEDYKSVGGEINFKQMELIKKMGYTSFKDLKWK